VFVIGEFFVNEVSFYRVEVGSFSLVLQDLHCFLDGAKWVLVFKSMFGIIGGVSAGLECISVFFKSLCEA